MIHRALSSPARLRRDLDAGATFRAGAQAFGLGLLALGLGAACAFAGSGTELALGVLVLGTVGALTVRQARRPQVATADGASTISLPAQWWLHPGLLVLLCGGTAAVFTMLIPAHDFLDLWRTPKYFTTYYGVLSLLLAGAFAVGAVATYSARRSRTGSTQRVVDASLQARVRVAAKVLSLLTLVGYGLWAAIALHRGLSAHDVLAVLSGRQGAVFAIKSSYLKPVAGVTTLVQFGPAAVAGLTLNTVLGGRRVRGLFGLILFLGCVRAVLNAERLALIELVVPWLVVRCMLARPGGVWRFLKARLSRVLLPCALAALVVGLFATLEYNRSWSFYRTTDQAGYGSFVVDRLAGYYVTANNNSVIALTHDQRSIAVPYYTFYWLWHFPLIDRFASYRDLTGVDPGNEWLSQLSQNGNPEFNNPGALLAVVYDYGPYGAILVWMLIGGVIGAVYAAARSGRIGAVWLYAVVAVGLFDSGREFYWSLGRAFPALIGVGVSALWIRSAEREAPRLRHATRWVPSGQDVSWGGGEVEGAAAS